MIRVYDTNALWWHDEILRIRHLEAEIADLQKEIDRQKQEAVSAILSLLGNRFLLFLFKFSQLLFERLVVVRRETQFLEKVIAVES